MPQNIKIIIEELIVNLQIDLFSVLAVCDALNYWKIKEICKQRVL